MPSARHEENAGCGRRRFLGGALASGAAFATRAARAADTGAAPAAGDEFDRLADAALSRAGAAGVEYADFRVVELTAESIRARELRVEVLSERRSNGCAVRVLREGTWGWASAGVGSAEDASALATRALDVARANRALRDAPVEIEALPGHVDRWVMPMQINPAEVSVDEKIGFLLEVNRAALRGGAQYCSSSLSIVRERKSFASSRGARIRQERVRIEPGFEVTAVDRASGRFATRESLVPPRGAGYEYVRECGLAAEAEKAAAEAKEKLSAPPVTPGRMDLVLHPTNLWLTIHESIGHATELDRALGYEADFAGTSFVLPEMLDRLRYASDAVTVRADRTQPGGLATVAYDDDGVRTAGAEFPIIERGIFRNYQLALGQARLIGRARSNGCAYADSHARMPISRMPNISLEPGPAGVGLDELIAGVKQGVYIVGNGSFSIDQQRRNFQFGGQLFYRIRDGQLAGMLRDVAYQADTVAFWNACDALAGPAEYLLGGSFSCGKGQPIQIAPVSHGAVPARFRGVNVINTGRDA